MSDHLTPGSARNKYVEAMGEPLGSVYATLWQEVAWLHMRWQEYTALFGKREDRIRLLNETAPTFFFVVQHSMWEVIVLHIARLIDKPRTAGRENLTLQSLAEDFAASPVYPGLASAVEQAVKTGAFATDWRNRRLAHTDRELHLNPKANPLKESSRALVGDSLKAIVAVLDVVCSHYLNGMNNFTTSADVGTADDLVRFLIDGQDHAAERMKRVQDGYPREDDLKPRWLTRG